MIDIGLGHYLTLGAIIFFLFKKIPIIPILKITTPKVK